MDKSSLPSFKCQFLTQAFSDRLPKAVPSHLLLFPDGTASFYLDRCYRAKCFPHYVVHYLPLQLDHVLHTGTDLGLLFTAMPTLARTVPAT